MPTHPWALIALTLAPIAVPDGPTDDAALLRHMDDVIADLSALDGDDLIDARDALLRTSPSRSLTLSFEALVWQGTAADRDTGGTSFVVGVRLQPEAWWPSAPDALAPRPCRVPPPALVHRRLLPRLHAALDQVLGCDGGARR